MIPIYIRRRMINIIHLTFSVLAMIFGLFWLFWILFVLVGKGLDGISVALFTEMTPAPGSAGGLLNAIVGSLMMVALATLIGTFTDCNGLSLAQSDDGSAGHPDWYPRGYPGGHLSG